MCDKKIGSKGRIQHSDKSVMALSQQPANKIPCSSFIRRKTSGLLVLSGSILMLIFASRSALAGRPFGVDVYAGSGTVNWTSAHNSGDVQFAWAKATEGTYYEDANYANNMANGKGAGVVMGGYHFARPDLDAPGSEAGYFWTFAGSHIKADGNTLMPMLDYETFNGVSGASSYAAWANTWCNDVVANGNSANIHIKPFIYISACNACELDGSVSQWFSQIANYNGEKSQTGNPWNVCSSCEVFGSGVWTGWQFTDTGSCPGISGDADEDVIQNSSLASMTVTTENTPVGAGRIDVFVCGTDYALFHEAFDNNQWYAPWEPITAANIMTSDPAAVSWASGRIDCFYRGNSGTCDCISYTGGTWIPNSIGGGMIGGPGVSSWGSGRLDVFVCGTDHALYHQAFDNNQWYGWGAALTVGNTLTSDPAAVSWGSGRIDCFYRGPSGSCDCISYTGSTWIPNSIGGSIIGKPGVSSWGTGRLDVFACGTDYALYHQAFYNSQWNGWEKLTAANTLTSGPTAVSSEVNRIDVYYRNSSGGCGTISWVGYEWVAGTSLGGGLIGGAGSSSWSLVP